MIVLQGAAAIAAHVGRTERTVRRWARTDRTFPVYRFKRALLADRAKLDAWLAVNTVHASEEKTGGGSPLVSARRGKAA